ncbi:hypothetical protein L3Y34_005677 [Caenorhabditis briggsae]|uniref:Uncharacterized protein n=2 Tax=Caenorhabditis briggsae TaxID=6238 RepID=A0AAE9IM76_CAEBR|nr:hypothetical protein L3Y34_005677 [Caenorhabditis briggsae]
MTMSEANKEIAIQVLTNPNGAQDMPRVSEREDANEIFRFIYNSGWEITKDISALIARKLEVSVVFLSRQGDISKLYDMMQRLKLRILVIKYAETEPPTSIMDFLNRLINLPTRQGLRTLSLDNSNLEFPENWILKLHQLVAFLSALHLRHIPLPRNEFLNLCNKFKKLERLEIHGSGVTSLQGIRQLQLLEVLRIGDVKIESSQAMMDIFELPKLRVLNLGLYDSKKYHPSSQPFSQNLKFFVACERTLPALEIIDCFQNAVDFCDIVKLVQSHNTLEVVGCLCISLKADRIPLFPARAVKFLTTQSIDKCHEAFDFYTKNEHFPDHAVLSKIFDSLDEYFKSLWGEDLKRESRRCLQKCLALRLVEIESKEIDFASIWFLQLFINTDSSFDEFGPEQIKEIGRILLEVLKKNPSGETEMDHFIRYSAWFILVKFEMLSMNPQIERELFQLTVETIRRSQSFADYTFHGALCVFKRFISEHNTAVERTNDDNSFKNHLIQMATSLNFAEVQMKYPKNLFYDFELVIRSLCVMETEKESNEESILCQRNAMGAIMQKAADFKEDLLLQEEMISNIIEFANHLDPKILIGHFNKNDWAFKQTLYLLNVAEDHSHFQEITFTYLLKVMQCVLEEHLLLGESRILQTKPTVDSILDACVEYQKSEGADDLEIIKWMRRQQDKPLVAEFAYWYMIAYDQENGREDVG